MMAVGSAIIFGILLLQAATAQPLPAQPGIGSVIVSNLPAIIAALAAAGVLWRGQQKESARSEIAAAQRQELSQKTSEIRDMVDGNLSEVTAKLKTAVDRIIELEKQVTALAAQRELEKERSARSTVETKAIETIQGLGEQLRQAREELARKGGQST